MIILFNGIVILLIYMTLTICSDPYWPIDNCNKTNETCRETTQRCETICHDGKCLIKVGIILTNNTKFIPNINTANIELENAKTVIRERNILPNNVEFQLIPYDDHCESAYGSLGVLDGYTECVNVYIGPICDYVLASAGRLVQYVGPNGIPLITPGGFVFDFTKTKTNCGDEFFMLVNSGQFDYRSLAEFFKYFLDEYNWNKIAFMYNQFDQNEIAGTQSCKLLMSSIMEEIKSGKLEYNDGDIYLLNVTYTQYFKREIGSRYGIITICANYENTREILLAAEELKMMDRGEYIFFNFEPYNNAPIPSKPWYKPSDTKDANERARKAYSKLYTFTPWKEAMFGVSHNKLNDDKRGEIYLDGVFDSLLIYANALNKTLKFNDGTVIDNQIIYGTDIINNIWGLKFEDKYEDKTIINCNGQRVTQYGLMQLNETGTNFHIVAKYNIIDKNVTFIRNITWPNNAMRPSDTPECGYDMSKCPPSSNANIVVISVSVVIGIGIVGFIYFLYRHYKLEAAIASMTWKVNFDEIKFSHHFRSDSIISITSKRCGSTMTLSEVYSLPGDRQLFTQIAYYKSIRVAIKEINGNKIELNREQLLELKNMKDLSNDHLVKFYGACLDVPNCYLLTEYCPKGSLQDILENDSVKLDRVFRMSLIHDIIRGMQYLHNSDIKSHGSLTSTNCVVDSRFVLKISDFGLHFLRTNDDSNRSEGDHSFWQRLLWTAPELLRMHNPQKSGTPKGDVYSFAIIVHEIETRQGVFYLGKDFVDPREIVDSVRNGPDGNHGQLLRPLIDDNSVDDEVTTLMRRCWAEEAQDRPDFNALKNTIRKLNKEYDNGNILDNLLSRMEQYANNLESLVEERTADYLEEKRKCEELLYQLLPKSVALQLITGESVIAETFDQVTIYFSDIVGFTALSAQSTPLQVVDLLNDLYTCFDSIIENFDVYKVETIGDAYMVVSGLPERNDNRHAAEIARMSLALLGAVGKFTIRHRPRDPLKLRIGMHTGPCVAGVVGLKMPRYCLFGDTVNTASRMESNGEPLKIHVSPITKNVLDTFGTFNLERRGEVEMKGKGKMVTYWLKGESVQNPKSVNKNTTEIKKQKGTTNIESSNVNNGSIRNVKILNISETNYQITDEAAVPLLSVTTVTESQKNV